MGKLPTLLAIGMTLAEEIAKKTACYEQALLHYMNLKRTHTEAGLALSPARQAVLQADDDLRVLRQDIIALDNITDVLR